MPPPRSIFVILPDGTPTPFDGAGLGISVGLARVGISTAIVLEEADGTEVVTLPVDVAHDASSMELTLTFDEPRRGGLDPWPSRSCLPVTPGGSGDFTLNGFVSMAFE